MSKVRGVYEKVRGSRRWWIQYVDSVGRRRRECVGTKSAAIELVEKRRNERREGKKMPENFRAAAVSFGDIAKAALLWSEKNKASYEHDKWRMAPLVEQFGARPAEGILAEEFESWLDKQVEERKWALATKNRYLALLKLTYRLAEKNRKLTTNPARLLRMRKEDNARIRYLSDAEETRLRKAITGEFSYHLPEFEIALHTGMRRSEQYRMTWGNIDFKSKVLTIPHSKHGGIRYISLNSTALAMLEFLKGRSEKTGRVFLSMRDEKHALSQNRHWFEDAVKEAGIQNFTWHCLRHTFASRLVMAGIDIRTVAELMGHRTIQMSMRYSHLAPKHLADAVERLTKTATATATRTATAPRKSGRGREVAVN